MHEDVPDLLGGEMASTPFPKNCMAHADVNAAISPCRQCFAQCYHERKEEMEGRESNRKGC